MSYSSFKVVMYMILLLKCLNEGLINMFCWISDKTVLGVALSYFLSV